MLQEIRKKLRLAMNGITSSAMREKGIDYKLNFGVPIMTLQKIAKNYIPNSELAEELWQENTRELKILATLLQPFSTFTNTLVWAKEINNLELAEQASMNLFSKTLDAPNNALILIQSNELYEQICGFLIYSRLFSNKYSLENKEVYFKSVSDALDSKSLLLKNTALTSLKKLGRQSTENAKNILGYYNLWSKSNPEKQTIYDDLKFELDYYS